MKKRHQEKKSDTSTCWNKWFIVCDEARRDEKLVYGHIHHIQHSHIISVTLNNSSDESQHNYLEAAGGKELTPVTWLSLSLEFRQSQTSAVKLGFGELKLVFFVFLNQLLLYSNADVTVQILKTAQLQLLQKHKSQIFLSTTSKQKSYTPSLKLYGNMTEILYIALKVIIVFKLCLPYWVICQNSSVQHEEVVSGGTF